jgi:hypothetical protein
MKRVLCAALLLLVAGAWNASPASASPASDRFGSRYLDGLLTDIEGSTQDAALRRSVAGSPAAEYAKQQAATVPIVRPLGPYKKSKVKGGYKVCDPQKESCVTFTAFRTQRSKLVTFSVDGKPLDQRLRVLNQSATDGPLTFSTRWAYVTNTDQLRLIVDVRNDGDRPLLPTAYDSVWIDANGRQHMNNLAGVAEAAPEVNAKATGTMTLSFDNPEEQIGGRVVLKAYDNNPPPDQPQAHYQVEIPLG